MNEALYDSIKRAVTEAIVFTDDSTPVGVIRNRAHDATYQALAATAAKVRELDEVSLESVLYLLGQRP